MPGNSDRFFRLLENFYTRVFEQTVPSFNRRLSNAIVATEDMETMDDFQGINYPVKARWYAPLSIIGTDIDDQESVFKLSPSGRVQYGSGVLNATQMSQAFRVRVDWDSDDAPVDVPTLFYWGDTTDFISVDWFNEQWRLRRSAGGVVNQVSVADSFTAGEFRTVSVKLTAAVLGVSVEGAPFVTTSATVIPTISSRQFDILSAGGN